MCELSEKLNSGIRVHGEEKGKKKHFLENINIHLRKPPEIPAIFSNKFALLIHQKKVI